MSPPSGSPGRSYRAALTRLAACVALGTLLLGGPAHAEERTDDARLGDEVDGELAPDDVHVWEFPVVAGTRLDLDLFEIVPSEEGGGGEGEGEGEEDPPPEGGEEEDPPEEDGEGEESTAEKTGGGPFPRLVLLDPDGVQVADADGERPRIRVVAAKSGLYELEVRAHAFAGVYELGLDGELPGEVEPDEPAEAGDDEPAVVHLEVPPGSTVVVDVRRIDGAWPEILDISDATGRSLGFDLRRNRRSRVITTPIPVGAPGGIDVTVGGREGGEGVYEVRGRPRLDDDDPYDEDDEDVDPRRIVLQLRSGADAEAVAEALGYEIVFYEEGTLVLETPEGREGLEDVDARAAAALLADVLGAEPDSHLEAPEGSQSNGLVLGSSLGRADFDQQKALSSIRATAAHRRATGSGLVVAVLDTGIDADHPLFGASVLPGFDFVDRDADPAEEANGLDDDGDGLTDEGWGHGTFVSGLVLASAPDARVLPVRVLDTDARGPASVVAAGVYYAVSQGADVINMSLGTRSRSETLRSAVAFAVASGVVVVAAAGNEGRTSGVDFPGAVRGTIAVTALDARGRRPAFANAGGRTLLGAPGVDVIGPYPGGGYAAGTGTSFAAALTAGGVATVLELRPRLRPLQIERRLRRRARRLARAIPRRQRRLVGGGQLDLRRLSVR